jgi:hypothetical protein
MFGSLAAMEWLRNWFFRWFIGAQNSVMTAVWGLLLLNFIICQLYTIILPHGISKSLKVFSFAHQPKSPNLCVVSLPILDTEKHILLC